MKASDAKEAAVLLLSLLPLLGQSGASDASIQAGADLRQAVGFLTANAEQEIRGGTVGTSLGACFDAARAANASFNAIDAARSAADGLVPVSAVAGIVVALFIRLAIACECQIIAATNFQSRDEVDGVRNALAVAFDSAIDAAAADGSSDAFVALTSLYAAAMRDLTARARPLPQIVSYSLPRRMPALWIANRFYGDGGRTDELIAENGPVHPLFMPAQGRALSR